jgi:hypothetical protein
LQGVLFLVMNSHGGAMGWKRSAPCGASDLGSSRAGFLNKAERLIHGVDFANHPENADKWKDMVATSGDRSRSQTLFKLFTKPPAAASSANHLFCSSSWTF